MKREEEIDNAKTAFYKRVLGDDYYYDPRDCFEEGAKWADSHPKSPWISVNEDLPCNHEELIRKNGLSTKRVIVIEDEGYFLDHMVFSNNEWDWTYATIPSHWMPIPKLP